jgi:hypothetical protein
MAQHIVAVSSAVMNLSSISGAEDVVGWNHLSILVDIDPVGVALEGMVSYERSFRQFVCSLSR